ncbi:MAG: hypothetical protein L6V81_01425 [Clostridium sp.]|nr:MAG: hypothetical protein L6V81_01425 [Clostridium sp.]
MEYMEKDYYSSLRNIVFNDSNLSERKRSYIIKIWIYGKKRYTLEEIGKKCLDLHEKE